jgi:hypothetical protein
LLQDRLQLAELLRHQVLARVQVARRSHLARGLLEEAEVDGAEVELVEVLELGYQEGCDGLVSLRESHGVSARKSRKKRGTWRAHLKGKENSINKVGTWPSGVMYSFRCENRKQKTLNTKRK